MGQAKTQIVAGSDFGHPTLYILEAALLTTLPELVNLQPKIADDAWNLLVAVQKLLHRCD